MGAQQRGTRRTGGGEQAQRAHRVPAHRVEQRRLHVLAVGPVQQQLERLVGGQGGEDGEHPLERVGRTVPVVEPAGEERCGGRTDGGGHGQYRAGRGEQGGGQRADPAARGRHRPAVLVDPAGLGGQQERGHDPLPQQVVAVPGQRVAGRGVLLVGGGREVLPYPVGERVRGRAGVVARRQPPQPQYPVRPRGQAGQLGGRAGGEHHAVPGDPAVGDRPQGGLLRQPVEPDGERGDHGGAEGYHRRGLRFAQRRGQVGEAGGGEFGIVVAQFRQGLRDVLPQRLQQLALLRRGVRVQDGRPGPVAAAR